MAKISTYKKLRTAQNVVNKCDFLTFDWENEHMMSLLLASFEWAEKTSDKIDRDAPYAIVDAQKKKRYG